MNVPAFILYAASTLAAAAISAFNPVQSQQMPTLTTMDLISYEIIKSCKINDVECISKIQIKFDSFYTGLCAGLVMANYKNLEHEQKQCKHIYQDSIWNPKDIPTNITNYAEWFAVQIQPIINSIAEKS